MSSVSDRRPGGCVPPAKKPVPRYAQELGIVAPLKSFDEMTNFEQIARHGVAEAHKAPLRSKRATGLLTTEKTDRSAPNKGIQLRAAVDRARKSLVTSMTDLNEKQAALRGKPASAMTYSFVRSTFDGLNRFVRPIREADESHEQELAAVQESLRKAEKFKEDLFEQLETARHDRDEALRRITAGADFRQDREPPTPDQIRLTSEYKELQSKLNEMTRAFAAEKEKFTGQADQLQKLVSQIDEKNARISRRDKRISHAQKTIDHQETQIVSLESKLRREKDKNEAHRLKVEALATEKDKLRLEFDAQKKENDEKLQAAAKTAAAQHQGELDEAAKALEQSKASLKRTEMELADFKIHAEEKRVAYDEQRQLDTQNAAETLGRFKAFLASELKSANDRYRLVLQKTNEASEEAKAAALKEANDRHQLDLQAAEERFANLGVSAEAEWKEQHRHEQDRAMQEANARHASDLKTATGKHAQDKASAAAELAAVKAQHAIELREAEDHLSKFRDSTEADLKAANERHRLASITAAKSAEETLRVANDGHQLELNAAHDQITAINDQHELELNAAQAQMETISDQHEFELQAAQAQTTAISDQHQRELNAAHEQIKAIKDQHALELHNARAQTTAIDEQRQLESRRAAETLAASTVSAQAELDAATQEYRLNLTALKRQIETLRRDMSHALATTEQQCRGEIEHLGQEIGNRVTLYEEESCQRAKSLAEEQQHNRQLIETCDAQKSEIAAESRKYSVLKQELQKHIAAFQRHTDTFEAREQLKSQQLESVKSQLGNLTRTNSALTVDMERLRGRLKEFEKPHPLQLGNFVQTTLLEDIRQYSKTLGEDAVILDGYEMDRAVLLFLWFQRDRSEIFCSMQRAADEWAFWYGKAGCCTYEIQDWFPQIRWTSSSGECGFAVRLVGDSIAAPRLQSLLTMHVE